MESLKETVQGALEQLQRPSRYVMTVDHAGRRLLTQEFPSDRPEQLNRGRLVDLLQAHVPQFSALTAPDATLTVSVAHQSRIRPEKEVMNFQVNLEHGRAVWLDPNKRR